ncbi:MAG: hypothetical protein ABEH47_07925 [Haloferacaceae archaeon]
MALDAEDVGTWLTRWWAEAALSLLVLGGAALGFRSGDAVRIVLAVVLGAALVDRARLRLDNRSLAVAVDEIREAGVSATRRATGARDAAAVGGDGAAEGTPGPADGERPVTAESGDAGTAMSERTEPAGRDAGTAADEERETLDREAIADLVGADDPANVDAEDIADLVRRAERESESGGEAADERSVEDLISEAEPDAGSESTDADGERDA